MISADCFKTVWSIYYPPLLFTYCRTLLKINYCIINYNTYTYSSQYIVPFCLCQACFCRCCSIVIDMLALSSAFIAVVGRFFIILHKNMLNLLARFSKFSNMLKNSACLSNMLNGIEPGLSFLVILKSKGQSTELIVRFLFTE